MSRRGALAVAIVAVPLLVYPLVTVAGGAPRLPSRSECVHRAVVGEPVDVVYGRFDDAVIASRRLDRVLAVGFKGTELQFDGCGQWVVLLEHVPSAEVGDEIAKEAHTVGLRPTLELDPGG